MVHTRWAMSYLRGPLTRQQVQILMADQRAKLAARQPAAAPRKRDAGHAGPGFAAQIAVAQQAAPTYTPSPPPPMNFPEAPPSLPEFPDRAAQPSTPLDYTSQSAASQDRAGGRSYRTRSRSPRSPHRRGFSAARLHELQPPVPVSVAQYFLPDDVSSQQAIADWERKTNFSRRRFRRRDAGLSPVSAGAGLGPLSGSQNAVVQHAPGTPISSRTSIVPGLCTGIRPSRAARHAPPLRRTVRRRTLRRPRSRPDRHQAHDRPPARTDRRGLQHQEAASSLQRGAQPLRQPGQRFRQLPLAASADRPRTPRRRNGHADRQIR